MWRASVHLKSTKDIPVTANQQTMQGMTVKWRLLALRRKSSSSNLLDLPRLLAVLQGPNQNHRPKTSLMYVYMYCICGYFCKYRLQCQSSGLWGLKKWLASVGLHSSSTGWLFDKNTTSIQYSLECCRRGIFSSVHSSQSADVPLFARGPVFRVERSLADISLDLVRRWFFNRPLLDPIAPHS